MVLRITTEYCDPDDPLYGEAWSIQHVRDFIDIQVDKITKDLKGYDYSPYFSNEHFQEYRIQNGIPLTERLNSKQSKDMDQSFYKIMEILIPLSVHIDEYYYAENYERYQYIRALIFSLYLLCWIYKLIISFYSLPENSLSFIYKVIDSEEPFSLININFADYFSFQQ